MHFLARMSRDHGEIFLENLRRLYRPTTPLAAGPVHEKKKAGRPGLFQAAAFHVCIGSGARTTRTPTCQ